MKTNRKQLIDVLKSAAPGLADKEMLALTQSFVLHGGRVATYNDMVSVSAPLPAGLGALEGAVKADELLKVLGRLGAEEISLEQTDADLVVTTPRTRAGVRREALTEDLLALSVEDPAGFSPVPAGLLEALEFCRFSASRNLATPLLCNVCIRGDACVSSDNFRLTVRRFTGGKLAEGDVLVPASVIPDLAAVAPAEYGAGGGWAHWRSAAGTVFRHRTVEGEYADVRRLLKVEGPKLPLPDGLAEGVERASVVLDTKDPDAGLLLTVAGGVLTVAAKGPNAWLKERYKTPDAPDLRFRIAPAILLDILGRQPVVTVGENTILIEGKGFKHVACLIAAGPTNGAEA